MSAFSTLNTTRDVLSISSSLLSIEDFKAHPFPSRFWNTLVVSKVFENRVLRKFGLKTGEVKGEWRKLHNEELNDLFSSPTFVRVI
jgi:hypothetical protein